MNISWKALILLCAVIGTAHSLMCRQCPVSILGTCLFGKDITCANSTESCFTGEAKFNATGAVSLLFRGCLDSDLCNKTVTGSLFGAGYTSTLQCCGSNLCNGATSMQLPLTMALFTGVLSSWWSFSQL